MSTEGSFDLFDGIGYQTWWSAKVLLIAGKHGRLANRLTLMSYFILFSLRHDVKVLFPALDEYAPYFISTREDPFCRYPPRFTHYRFARSLGHFIYRTTDVLSRLLIKVPRLRQIIGLIVAPNEQITDLASSDFCLRAKARSLTLVRGWFFGWSEVLTEEDLGVLRAFFRLVPDVWERVERKVARARDGDRPLVGVHIRRGDYQEWREGEYLFSSDRYASTMKRVEELLPQRPTFLICSDENVEVEEFADLDITLAQGSDVEDLYCLSRCDMILGPPSTYSRWASLVGGVPLYVMEGTSSDFRLADFEVVRELRAV